MTMGDKFNELYGVVHELKPIIFEIRDSQKVMECRIRDSEIKTAEHKVKINRIEIDLDGLGKKLRVIPIHAARLQSGSKFDAFLEFLLLAPKFWHIIMTVAMAIITVFTIAWHRKP